MSVIRRVVIAAVPLLIVGTLVAPRTATAVPTTFVVTSPDDPGDGVCGPVCTLREAIFAANTNGNPTEVDTIAFDLAGDGPHTISPQTELPTVLQPAVIDGYTQGDATAQTTDDAVENTIPQGATNAVLKIVIDGTLLGDEHATGVSVQAPGSTIRGLVVSNFDPGHGISLGESDNRLEGSFVGTDVTGTLAGGNGTSGVPVDGLTSGVRIGGLLPAARNLISANNGNGIMSFSTLTDLTIQGNLIGTAADGVSPLGNGRGMQFFQGPNSDMQIGGTSALAANTIAFSDVGHGIGLTQGGSGAAILGNSIHSNATLGIDLLTDGVSPNDRKDPDTGPNNLQNFPVLTLADLEDDQITVAGTMDSRPRKNFRIQFFSSADGDEGKTSLGETTVRTNRKGRKAFTVVLTAPPPGEAVITATATNVATGDTSEFSAPKDAA